VNVLLYVQFRSLYQMGKDEIEIFCGHVVRFTTLPMIIFRHLTCASRSSVKIEVSRIKISAFVQLHMLFEMAEKINL
jgi:hypothetical protein